MLRQARPGLGDGEQRTGTQRRADFRSVMLDQISGRPGLAALLATLPLGAEWPTCTDLPFSLCDCLVPWGSAQSPLPASLLAGPAPHLWAHVPHVLFPQGPLPASWSDKPPTLPLSELLLQHQMPGFPPRPSCISLCPWSPSPRQYTPHCSLRVGAGQ